MVFSRVFLTPPSLGAPLLGLGARAVPVGLDCFAALVLGVRVLEFIFMVSKATLIIRFTFVTWWSRACKWTAERRKRVVRVAEALAGFSSRSNFLESPWNCSGLKYGLERCRRYQSAFHLDIAGLFDLDFIYSLFLREQHNSQLTDHH